MFKDGDNMEEGIAFCSYCEKCKDFRWCNPCPVCKQELQQFPIDGRDLLTISLFCHDDKDFVNSMIKLHEENIVDYKIRLKEIENLREQEKLQRQQQEQANLPKCPTCGSTNIRKIGSVERGTSIVAFGIFSKKINKTFKCGNCGYTW